ncbi:MAG: MoxR family ATPase [Clostridiales bacterium]|nr:MoxR family ATPase [Clostridiales bacterium]
MEEYITKINELINEIKKVVIGKDEIIIKVLTAILAKGHILIEDIPGVGKTTLALAFSKAMELEYHRMQFTPDVLPSDVVGFHVYDKDGQDSHFKQGSIFCNMFLADEINRTSSKTQSALLEVMEEGRVTVDAITREVPKPFVVIATQNPIGSAGTQMLPESQLDRFMVRLSMGYPDMQSEVEILKGRNTTNPMDSVDSVITQEDLLILLQVVDQIFVHDAVYQYIAALVLKTREHDLLQLGVSPRGTLALTSMAKAYAFVCGRTYVIPDDVRIVFKDVVTHRLILKPKARVNNVTVDMIIDQILQTVPAPRMVVK